MTDTLTRLARIMHRLRLRSPATVTEKREWAAIRQAASEDARATEHEIAENYYTITDTDVSQPSIRAFGKVWSVSDFIGRILKRDVGKRVYQRGWIVQVENDAQRDARLATLCGDCGREEGQIDRWCQQHNTWHRLCPPCNTTHGTVAPASQCCNAPLEYDCPTCRDPHCEECGLPVYVDMLTCECADAGCKAAPWHLAIIYGGETVCGRPGEMHLFRVDMGDTGPVVFCEPCGSDALDSGVFAVGDDLEPRPYHGLISGLPTDSDGNVLVRGGQS